MSRRSVITVLAATVLAAAPGVLLGQCEVGFRPGSTLLFPYFEVDLSNPNGVTTLISINDESGGPALTRVVVWTDWAHPVLAFDLYLKPQDVQTINLRDLLNGVIPSTGDAGLLAFNGCQDHSPTHPNPALTADEVRDLKFFLTGFSPNGYCEGERYGDNHARGYITVDTVRVCSGISNVYLPGNTPTSSTYFTDFAIVQNVLWGDLIYVDPTENSAQGVEAVAIRGDDSVFNRPGPVNTFYGRYIGWTGRDQRSPLPTFWQARFLNGGVFSGGTDYIVYRDVREGGSGAVCGAHPSWYPLFGESLTAHDEDGNLALSFGPNGVFGLATQRVAISSLEVDGLAAVFGRMDLDLSLPDGKPAGAWVIPIMIASGKFSVDFNGQPVDTGCGRNPLP